MDFLFAALTAANKTESHTSKRLLGEIVGVRDTQRESCALCEVIKSSSTSSFCECSNIAAEILDMILRLCETLIARVHFTSWLVSFASVSSVVCCPCKGEHRPLLLLNQIWVLGAYMKTCKRRRNAKPLFHIRLMGHNEFHFPLKLLNSKPHDDERNC